MVEISLPAILITVVVLLVVLAIVYMVVQSEGEGEMLEVALELLD